jgi:hypothetical protein
MPKEDVINVYTLGTRRYRDSFDGVCAIDHDINRMLDSLSVIASNRADEYWSDSNEFYISKEEKNIADYINCMVENLSYEEATKLADEHGFTLKEINCNYYE